MKNEQHWNWKGGRRITSNGYVMVKAATHPRACKGYVFEHILVMEKALGRYLLPGETPHHRDEVKSNNEIGNLILFKTSAMHTRFHTRLRAFQITGHWDWLKCCYCGQYDTPKNIFVNPNESKKYHKSCSAAKKRERRLALSKEDGR